MSGGSFTAFNSSFINDDGFFNIIDGVETNISLSHFQISNNSDPAGVLLAYGILIMNNTTCTNSTIGDGSYMIEVFRSNVNISGSVINNGIAAFLLESCNVEMIDSEVGFNAEGALDIRDSTLHLYNTKIINNNGLGISADATSDLFLNSLTCNNNNGGCANINGRSEWQSSEIIGNSRRITLFSNSQTIMNNIICKENSADEGGCVHVTGILECNDCLIQNNTATVGEGGDIRS